MDATETPYYIPITLLKEIRKVGREVLAGQFVVTLEKFAPTNPTDRLAENEQKLAELLATLPEATAEFLTSEYAWSRKKITEATASRRQAAWRREYTHIDTVLRRYLDPLYPQFGIDPFKPMRLFGSGKRYKKGE